MTELSTNSGLKVHQHLLWVITLNLLSIYFRSLQKTDTFQDQFFITFLPSAHSSQFLCQHCDFVLFLHKTLPQNELESCEIDKAFNLLSAEDYFSRNIFFRWRLQSLDSPCKILVTQYTFCRVLAETWWGSTFSHVSLYILFYQMVISSFMPCIV